MYGSYFKHVCCNTGPANIAPNCRTNSTDMGHLLAISESLIQVNRFSPASVQLAI